MLSVKIIFQHWQYQVFANERNAMVLNQYNSGYYALDLLMYIAVVRQLLFIELITNTY